MAIPQRVSRGTTMPAESKRPLSLLTQEKRPDRRIGICGTQPTAYVESSRSTEVVEVDTWVEHTYKTAITLNFRLHIQSTSREKVRRVSYATSSNGTRSKQFSRYLLSVIAISVNWASSKRAQGSAIVPTLIRI